MLRHIFRTLGFAGFVKCIVSYPFYVAFQKKLERENRQVAESFGMTFEEYRKNLIIYRGDDGKILTDQSAIEARQKKAEAEARAYALAQLKEKYGYTDF